MYINVNVFVFIYTSVELNHLTYKLTQFATNLPENCFIRSFMNKAKIYEKKINLVSIKIVILLYKEIQSNIQTRTYIKYFSKKKLKP